MYNACDDNYACRARSAETLSGEQSEVFRQCECTNPNECVTGETGFCPTGQECSADGTCQWETFKPCLNNAMCAAGEACIVHRDVVAAAGLSGGSGWAFVRSLKARTPVMPAQVTCNVHRAMNTLHGRLSGGCAQTSDCGQGQLCAHAQGGTLGCMNVSTVMPTLGPPFRNWDGEEDWTMEEPQPQVA